MRKVSNKVLSRLFLASMFITLIITTVGIVLHAFHSFSDGALIAYQIVINVGRFAIFGFLVAWMINYVKRDEGDNA